MDDEPEGIFRKVFEYSHDAIFILDPAHDEILDVNPRACAMLEYAREELVSLPVSAIHPKEMPRLRAFAQTVFEQGHGWTDELTCTTHSGKRLPSEISASTIEIGERRCLTAIWRR